MKDEYLLAVITVDDPTRGLNDLAITGPLELRGLVAALRMGFQLPNMLKDPPDYLRGRLRVLQSDVVSNGVQIRKGWLSPDYFSHRAMRVLA